MARKINSFPVFMSSALFVLIAVSVCSQKASAAPLRKCPAGETYIPMTITGCDTCLADIRARQPSGSTLSNYACNMVDGGAILCEGCFKYPPPPPPPSPPPPSPPPPPSGFCSPSDQNVTLTTTGCDVCLDKLMDNKPSGTYLTDYSCTGTIGSNKCEGCFRKLASPPPPPPAGFCAPSDQHVILTTTGCDVCLAKLNENKPSGTYIFDYACTGVIGSNKCEACFRKFASPPPPASSCSCQKEIIIQDPTEPGKEACRYILAPKLAMV